LRGEVAGERVVERCAVITFRGKRRIEADRSGRYSERFQQARKLHLCDRLPAAILRPRPIFEAAEPGNDFLARHPIGLPRSE
jgi:hypothetical protein